MTGPKLCRGGLGRRAYRSPILPESRLALEMMCESTAGIDMDGARFALAPTQTRGSVPCLERRFEKATTTAFNGLEAGQKWKARNAKRLNEIF